MLEVASLGAHVEADIADLVGLVMTVHGHDDGALEFIDHGFVEFLFLRLVIRMTHLLHTVAIDQVLDQLEAVVNRQILADVVDDQVETALEDPGRGEEARPGLDGTIEDLGLRSHEETGVPSDLAEVGVAHLGLDD